MTASCRPTPSPASPSRNPSLAPSQGTGDKQLIDITVDTDGLAGTATATVTATDNHPFWVPDLAEWIDAGALQVGQWLRTNAGTWVQVAAIRRHAAHTTVHNLTIAGHHTYYVVAGGIPVLVHNDNGGLGDNINLYGDYTARMDQFNVRGQASFEIHVYYKCSEVGIYGSNGFFNKHGINAGDVALPDQVNNRLKGIAVDQMRKLGQLAPNDNIEGDAWKRPMIGAGGGCQ